MNNAVIRDTDMHLTESERRTLAKLYEAARTIRNYTNLPTSFVLPLHCAPGLRKFHDQEVRHAQGVTAHVSVIPR